MGEEEKNIKIELDCPCSKKVLSLIRSVVNAVSREMGFSDEEIAQIEMSVDEACSNVVFHAYRKKKKESPALSQARVRINLVITAAQDHLHITISDFGVGNKKGSHDGARTLEDYIHQGHGLGTFIMKRFMDKVEVFYPQESGTVVSMIKYLPRYD